MRSSCLALPLSFALLAFGAQAAPAVVELHVGEKLPRADLLTPSVHRYLRYTVTPDGHRNAIDIWSREISFEDKDGRSLLHIHQQWDEAAKPAVLVQDSWFERDTLRPITQVRQLTRDGKTTVGGYRFLPDKIIGMDDLPGNMRKGFVQLSPEPTNNWETDIEYLQALPLAEGYSASINFYDPGLDPPGRYIYSVTGSGRIATADGSAIDCWIVSTDFKTDSGVTTGHFWFSKTTQILIREEAKMPDGSVLVKTLLNPED